MLTGIEFDEVTVLAAAAIVLGGAATIWGIKKVIGLFNRG